MSTASAASPRFLSRSDLSESPRDQVSNIFEMPLLPTLALRLAAGLRHREMTVDPRLTDEKRWIAGRGEGYPQSAIFRQPAVSEVAAHQQTERKCHPCADELSWQPKQLQAKRPDPVFDAPGEKVHSFA